MCVGDFMDNNFGKTYFDMPREIIDEDGSKALVFSEAFTSSSVDFKDRENINVMATSAMHTADGLYELILGNCDVLNPSITSNHIELYLALSGLACEIYMKSIIYRSDNTIQKRLREHRLEELYKMLPVENRNTIQENIPDIVQKLSAVSNVFTILRYDFEINNFSGEYFVVFSLMKELREIAYSYPVSYRPTMRVFGKNAFIK